MQFRSILAVAALMLVAGQALAQQPPASYDPRDPREAAAVQRLTPPAPPVAPQPPAAAAPQVDQQEQARQRFAAWQQEKISCYRRAGLTDRDWRVSPTNPDVLQIADRIWRNPSGSVNIQALRACQ